MLKIGIIIASVRDERLGKQVGDWVLNYLKSKNDMVELTLIDLKEYTIPLLGITTNQEDLKNIKAWKDIHTAQDGFILVLPEYNHSVPGAYKNASDYLKDELKNKAIGYIGYGGVGSARSIEHMRLINAEQQLASVQKSIHFSLFTDFNEGTFKPAEFHKDNLDILFKQVINWSTALKKV